MGYEGVIETATGDLLRCGYTDFANDGSFDAATESIRTDVPNLAAVKKPGAGGTFDRLDGAVWVKVA